MLDNPQEDQLAERSHEVAPNAGARNFAGKLNLTGRSMKEEFLDRETEVVLARAWLDHNDFEARERLITSHLRLASGVVKSMKRNGHSINDLMQEAVIGLMRATDKFEPEYGNRFATYAKFWVKAAVQDAVMRDNSTVRLKSSSKNRTIFFTLTHIEFRAEKRLRQNGENPTDAEITVEAARMMNMDVSRLEEIRNTIPNPSSLDAQIVVDGSETGSRIDRLQCVNPCPEETLIKSDTNSHAAKILASAMENLNAREVRIIQSRKGSLDPLTLEVLSFEFGVTRERIRQIEVKAMEKLRANLIKLGITDFESFRDSF
jgi:RNA polymerase sigma-32 factor